MAAAFGLRVQARGANGLPLDRLLRSPGLRRGVRPGQEAPGDGDRYQVHDTFRMEGTFAGHRHRAEPRQPGPPRR